jgi:hypothetical protein
MQRTKYFNHTRPSETQLNWTENSRVSSILERSRENFQFGIVSGFTITINGSDQTKVDISEGEGYTGGKYLLNSYVGANSGERVSTRTATVSGGVATNIFGVALADYVNGTKNYISLVYVEDEAYPLSERTFPFTAHDTVVTETYSVSVMTEANWNLLSAADLNERTLLGIVTARGAGVAITAADIDQFVQPKTHPTPTQPITITGVTIVGVSGETPTGSGTLRYDSTTHTFFWAAPLDTEGSGQAVLNSCQVTVTSANLVDYIVINVDYGSLPVGNLSDTITIRALYGRTIPMACAKDTAHRDMVGSGVVSVTNPHGIALADISGGSTESDDLLHVNGIVYEADADQLLCAINVDPTKIEVNNFGGPSNSFFVDGYLLDALHGIPAPTKGSIDFTGETVEGDYLFYLDSAGNLGTVLVSAFTSTGIADADVLDPNIRIYDMANNVAGDFVLAWDPVTRLMTYKAPGDVPGAAVYIASQWGAAAAVGYYKLFSSNTDNWIILRFTDDPVGVGWTRATLMTAAAHSEEMILKLGIGCWNVFAPATRFVAASVRDIRQWYTSDIRPSFLTEHDKDGYHTKPLRNPLSVEVTGSNAICGFAGDSMGVYGSANYMAVYGSAASGLAGVFVASSTAVLGYASDEYGGMFTASNTAVYASATENIGGYFKASIDYGVFGSAKRYYGGYFTASLDFGVYGSAGGDYGVYGWAASSYGGWFTASNYGIVGLANASVAGTAYGASVEATNRKSGENVVGVYGSADATAATVFGVYGYLSCTDISPMCAGFFSASNDGTGPAYGIRAAGIGKGAYVYGASIGAFGSYNGDIYGLSAIAQNSSVEAKEIGIKGACAGTVGTGIYGKGGASAGGIGVYGVGATAVYGLGGEIGVWGSAVTAVYAKGLIRYDVDTCAHAGPAVIYLPVVVSNADGGPTTWALALTQIA